MGIFQGTHRVPYLPLEKNRSAKIHRVNLLHQKDCTYVTPTFLVRLVILMDFVRDGDV